MIWLLEVQTLSASCILPCVCSHPTPGSWAKPEALIAGVQSPSPCSKPSTSIPTFEASSQPPGESNLIPHGTDRKPTACTINTLMKANAELRLDILQSNNTHSCIQSSLAGVEPCSACGGHLLPLDSLCVPLPQNLHDLEERDTWKLT